MDNQLNRPRNSSGFQYAKNVSNDLQKTKIGGGQGSNKRDEDLIIEDNTIYEIDRECYERVKKQKRRK